MGICQELVRLEDLGGLDLGLLDAPDCRHKREVASMGDVHHTQHLQEVPQGGAIDEEGEEHNACRVEENLRTEGQKSLDTITVSIILKKSLFPQDSIFHSVIIILIT